MNTYTSNYHIYALLRSINNNHYLTPYERMELRNSLKYLGRKIHIKQYRYPSIITKKPYIMALEISSVLALSNLQ